MLTSTTMARPVAYKKHWKDTFVKEISNLLFLASTKWNIHLFVFSLTYLDLYLNQTINCCLGDYFLDLLMKIVGVGFGCLNLISERNNCTLLIIM